MSATHDNIVILGVKRTVIAFDKQTGARLWTKELSSGLSGDFVTVVADANRVYAHTHGEIYSLDLATGSVLWHDGLTGLGYGIASIALPGVAGGITAALAARIHEDRARDAAVASSGTSS
jgi:outer membrane protein assembly factor BamB